MKVVGCEKVMHGVLPHFLLYTYVLMLRIK